MDISDGLITDMNKLINMQKLSFDINVNKIPISKNLEFYLKYFILIRELLNFQHKQFLKSRS